MKINFGTKRELIFIISGLIILSAVIVFFVYSINFLVRNLNAALSADSAATTPAAGFNLDGLKELGIKE